MTHVKPVPPPGPPQTRARLPANIFLAWRNLLQQTQEADAEFNYQARQPPPPSPPHPRLHPIKCTRFDLRQPASAGTPSDLLTLWLESERHQKAGFVTVDITLVFTHVSGSLSACKGRRERRPLPLFNLAPALAAAPACFRQIDVSLLFQTDAIMNILIRRRAATGQDLAGRIPRGPRGGQSSLGTRVSGDYHGGVLS